MPDALDPELAAVAGDLPDITATDVPAAREALDEAVAAAPAPQVDGAQVREEWATSQDGTAVRLLVHVPDDRRVPAALLDVHGGGFVLGAADHSEPVNLAHARDLGAVVVAVDYRLAPEHPYPAALEDCAAALDWIVEHAAELGVDPAATVVRGASAGAGLCAALTLLARDRGGPPIAFQYLAMPALDDRLTSPSMRAFTDTPGWRRADAEASWDAYLDGRDGAATVTPYAAPARATDLSGLPPAYVSVMHFDPLRDEGIAYALALLAAGVAVELHLFPGTFHGSAMVLEAQVSGREIAEGLAVLARALAPHPLL